jgi:hypothetical protein
VAQLYPQAPSTHFSRLLRHAWATVELFFSPVTTWVFHHMALRLIVPVQYIQFSLLKSNYFLEGLFGGNGVTFWEGVTSVGKSMKMSDTGSKLRIESRSSVCM